MEAGWHEKKWNLEPFKIVPVFIVIEQNLSFQEQLMMTSF